ncbi:zinc finger protein 184-like [Agrilus planipennis]|uniref:Zinc finger protein 184-like n=1 Tax=Agrilus planipennis TaxID=224129 RepID=A0A1W4XMK5_AGRPL|nr:zinc finger protein 184-like [Agrilus planipennis]
MMKTYSRKKPDEQQEVILHLNELCRLCMTKEDELVPIFSDQDTVPLTLRIMACVSLEVFEGDGLPDKICHPCKFQLEKSYIFRKKCEQSDMKLRQHLKMLHERIGDVEVSEMDVTETVESEAQEHEKEECVVVGEQMNSEQDLVGLPKVTYIEPEVEIPDEDPQSITLPIETDNINKDACTINNLPLKKEVVELDGDSQEEYDDESNNMYLLGKHEETSEFTNQQSLEQQDLDAITDAVKQTLASHPDLNISGELQMTVDQQPGKPTQVQVTTADGSVVVMELTAEDEVDIKLPPYVDEENDEDGELKIFHCPDCPKSFSRRIQLRRHASVHMQQRGFSCGICEKWFPTRSALIRHERIHTGERPFQCEVCQKSFAQKEILFRHLMTHTGQKPYNCPHCPKGFTQKEPLRVHLRSHLNPNPTDIQLHYCSLCPKVFCHASGLSRHLVTHTGKTFKCRDCDKIFTDKSSLRRHHRQTQHQP